MEYEKLERWWEQIKHRRRRAWRNEFDEEMVQASATKMQVCVRVWGCVVSVDPGVCHVRDAVSCFLFSLLLFSCFLSVLSSLFVVFSFSV